MLIISCLFCSNSSWGQNFDKIGNKGERASVSGGFQINSIGYAQSGLVTPSREPFTWFASGNVNVNILDVALPFTFTYSNQGGSYTQPFNRTAFHPSYKWAKAHIGLINMNFSPYTLTGHLFLGGGIELTPGNWKVMVMGGRLNKRIEYNSLEDNLNQLMFDRWGYGAKVGYSKKGYEGSISFFKGQDNPNSLIFTPLNSEVKPQDNLSFSLEGKGKLTSKLHVEMSYALSALTNNISLNDSVNANQEIKFLHPIISGNSSTSAYHAYNTGLRYTAETMSVGINFEQIDPGYKTLGGYFFNNDLRNITITPTFTLFQKKLNVAINTGYQVNNLGEDKSATTSRWVGSLNASYSNPQGLILNGSYSNFSTFTRNRPNTDPFYYGPADTLNFFQLSQNASLMTGYSFGSDSLKHSIQMVYNYQVSETGNINSVSAFGFGLEELAPPIGVLTKVHSGNLNYALQFPKSKTSIAIAANVNRSISEAFESTFFGPTINLSKGLLNGKSTLSIGSTYNQQFSYNELVGNVFNHRVSFSYSPEIKNKEIGIITFSTNANLMQRLPTSTTVTKINEFNIFVNLGYSF